LLCATAADAAAAAAADAAAHARAETLTVMNHAPYCCTTCARPRRRSVVASIAAHDATL
jgi:hypothetical protein